MLHMQIRPGGNVTVMPVWILHMTSMHSTMWPWDLVYIHFTFIGICPWKNMPATLHIYVPLYYYCSLHIDFQVQVKKTATFNYHSITIYMPKTNILFACQIYPICTNYFMCRYKATLSVYIPSYELVTTNNVTRDSGKHTCHIIGIWPRTNMTGTLHIYILLYVYCRLHTDPTLLQITANITALI